MTPTLDHKVLGYALDGLKTERERITKEIDEKIASVKALMGTSEVEETHRRGPGRPKKDASANTDQKIRKTRVMTPEARQRISDAQKKRWGKTSEATTDVKAETTDEIPNEDLHEMNQEVPETVAAA